MRPTSKRAARIAAIGVALVAVAGALLWFLLNDPESRGPLIQGKPVAYWTGQFRLRQMDRNRDVINTLTNEKSVAIPALVRQLSLPDSAVKDFAKRIWLRLPTAVRAKVPEPTTRAELRLGAAFALERIYGPGLGKPDPDGPTLSEAQTMLPALIKALHDSDRNVRLNAVNALGNLEVISAQAIDACEVALKDSDWMVRFNAVYALSRLARGDDQAISCLKSALSDSQSEVRNEAAAQLKLLGIAPPHASSATEAK